MADHFRIRQKWNHTEDSPANGYLDVDNKGRFIKAEKTARPNARDRLIPVLKQGLFLDGFYSGSDESDDGVSDVSMDTNDDRRATGLKNKRDANTDLSSSHKGTLGTNKKGAKNNHELSDSMSKMSVAFHQ